MITVKWLSIWCTEGRYAICRHSDAYSPQEIAPQQSREKIAADWCSVISEMYGVCTP